MTFNPEVSQALSSKLRSLHTPGNALLLTNIWDARSASIALANPHTKAVATASFALAAVLGLEDEELTLEDNLNAISRIVARLRKEGKFESVPLTCDLQDGYGEKLKEAVEKVVRLGVVGCNIEDSRTVDGVVSLVDVDEQVERIKTAVATAAELGVPGFVINARSDAVLLGGTVEESIKRGKKYLAAGACTVFVWGGMKRGLRDAEVKQLVDGLDGKVNVIWRKSMEDGLSVKEIKELGVARISMGPGLWREAMTAVEKEMGRLTADFHG